MNKRFNIKYITIGLAIAAIIGALTSWISGLPFWASFAIVLFAMILNGVLAEHEDNLPGGFNNPMSKDEIEIENKKRRKRLLPFRIGCGSILLLVLLWLTWLYLNRKV
jgi:hypothetical protein